DKLRPYPPRPAERGLGNDRVFAQSEIGPEPQPSLERPLRAQAPTGSRLRARALRAVARPAGATPHRLRTSGRGKPRALQQPAPGRRLSTGRSADNVRASYLSVSG